MLLALVVEVVTPVVHICQNSLEWYSSNGCVLLHVKYTLLKFVLKLNIWAFYCLTERSKVDPRQSQGTPSGETYRSLSIVPLLHPLFFSFGKKLVFIICTNGGEQWPREFKKKITYESFTSDGSGMRFVAYLVCE